MFLLFVYALLLKTSWWNQYQGIYVYPKLVSLSVELRKKKN